MTTLLPLRTIPVYFSLSSFTSISGVRHICLIGQQTVACALVTSVVFGAVSWRREDAFYPALLLVVIGSECWSFGRMRELAVKLGGTCVAYALITPTTVTKYVWTCEGFFPGGEVQ